MTIEVLPAQSFLLSESVTARFLTVGTAAFLDPREFLGFEPSMTRCGNSCDEEQDATVKEGQVPDSVAGCHVQWHQPPKRICSSPGDSNH